MLADYQLNRLLRSKPHVSAEASAIAQEAAHDAVEAVSGERPSAGSALAAAAGESASASHFLKRPLSTLVRFTAASTLVAIACDAVGLRGAAGVLLLPLWRLGAVACCSWAATIYSSIAIKRFADRYPNHADDFELARVAAARGIAGLAFVTVLGIFRVPLSGLLAFGGAGGVIAGLSVQRIASDALAGAALLLRKSVREGDTISIPTPTGRVEGVVARLGITALQVTTADCATVTIPHSAIQIMYNRSRPPATQLAAAFAVPMVRAAETAARLESMLASHPAVLQEAVDGTLRNAVTLEYAADGTFVVSMQAYVAAGEGAEAARRNVLLKAAAIVEEAPGARGSSSLLL